MNFFIYIFYRLNKLYKYKNSKDSWMHAFILIGALLAIHIITILLFFQSFINNDLINSIRIDNGLIDRFILFPLLIAPIYIVLFVYYRRNKNFINLKISEYKKEDIKQKRKKGVLVVLYIFLTFSLLLSSITSPLWIN
ncbi:MAG: hypothetical protein ACOC0C_09270 [Bacteroidota bacterium]